MSDIQGAKAISMVTNGRIVESGSTRTFYAARSHGGWYTVVTSAGGDICDCEATGGCYHVRAAHLLMAKQRREATA